MAPYPTTGTRTRRGTMATFLGAACTAAPAVGVKAVRSVTRRGPRFSALRLFVPMRQRTVRTPCALAVADARHQVVSLRVPVVARWVMVPAPDTRTLLVMSAPVRPTVPRAESTVTLAGVTGAAVGTTAAVGTDAGPGPNSLLAVTVKVYAAPVVSPLTVQLAEVVVQVLPPGRDVTV